MVLIAGTAGMAAAIPGSPPGMGVFIDQMMEALSMDRSQFSLAYTFGTVFAGLSAPLAGHCVDRYGARKVACLGFALLGCVLVYTGLLQHITSVLPAGSLHAILSFGLVFIAFAGIRLIGVGLCMTACRSMIFKWFEGRRGWAAAINGVVLSLSFSSAPVFLNGVVLAVGWQLAWMYTGVFFAVAMTIWAYLFFRDSPESCGVEVEQVKSKGSRTRIPVVRDFRGSEALRTAAFWIFTSGLALNALIGTGVSFHFIAIAELEGLGRQTAVNLFLYIAIFHISTTLIMGALSSRFPMKYLLMLMVGAQAASLIGVLNLSDAFWRWVYIAGNGVAWGSFGILINVPWPRFFGRLHLGSINGWVTGATVATSALGPYLFGLLAEKTGSFGPACWICIAVSPLVLVAAIFADNPQGKAEGEG